MFLKKIRSERRFTAVDYSCDFSGCVRPKVCFIPVEVFIQYSKSDILNIDTDYSGYAIDSRAVSSVRFSGSGKAKNSIRIVQGSVLLIWNGKK